MVEIANVPASVITPDDYFIAVRLEQPATVALYSLFQGKQDTLVSGSNIKTINGQAILGSGDLTITAPSLDWTGITGKPTEFPPEDHTHPTSEVTGLDAALTGKQATLVSGTNIKTINTQSLLGSGDLTISPSSAWGTIEGVISTQTDLITLLNAKQATLVSGTNIKTLNGESLLGATDIVINNITQAERDKLATVALNATQNAPDAILWDRTYHTGLQKIATVEGLHEELDSKQDISGLATGAFVKIHVGTTAPSSPAVGDLWVDTN